MKKQLKFRKFRLRSVRLFATGTLAISAATSIQNASAEVGHDETNAQIPEDHPAARQVGEAILQALGRNPLFGQIDGDYSNLLRQRVEM